MKRKMKDKMFEGIFGTYQGKPVANSFVCNKWDYMGKPRMKDDIIPVVSPVNGEIIGYTLEATQEQMEIADKWARRAQEYWHLEVGQQEKEEVFLKYREYITKYRAELAKTMTWEMGKPAMTADGEIQEMLDTIVHYFGELSRIAGEAAECQMKNKFAITMACPVGVIYAIAPWNFPLAISCGWKALGAITGGNAVVIKPSSQSPFTAALGAALFHQALKDVLGKKVFDDYLCGLAQVIQGSGGVAGNWYLRFGNYDAVAFTGGASAGAKIAETAGRRIKPVHLELGGHGAIAVFEDFDLDRAVSEAIGANTGDAGQRCVSARVVFVEESICDKFIEKYIFALKSRRIGNPFDVETQIGPLANKWQLEKVAEAVEKAKKECGEWVGGEILNSQKAIKEARKKHWNIRNINPKGCYYLPAVLINPKMDSLAMREEIFGPVLCVKTFSGKTREEKIKNAADLMNASDYGLSNAVLTYDIPAAFQMMKLVKTGILYIGRGTSGAELNRYFGGVKKSGFGREGKGVGAFTYIKQVYIDFHPETRLAQIGAADKVAESLKGKKTIFE